MKMKQISILGFLILLFTACGGGGDSSNGSSSPSGDLKKVAGDKYYGGVFKINENEYLRSLYPLNITEVVGHRIANAIYEGLIKLDQETLQPLPAIAESWTVSPDAKKYVFKIRQGVKYHDSDIFPDGKGRTVTANDFKYVFDLLCTPDVNNQGFNFYQDRLKGAKEYYKSVQDGAPLAGGVAGATVIDDYTFQVELDQPFGSFLTLLAMPFVYAFPKEAIDKYGNEMRTNAVGTGPFVLKTVKEDEAVVLIKNKDYWAKDDNGNQLPYLDAVKYTFMKQGKAELLAFEQGNLDMKFRLPLELADEVVDRSGNLTDKYKQFVYQDMVSMSIFYYGFQHKKELFNNKKLRQAFNYAIDRDALVEYTLKGQGLPATMGIVPPAFAAYNANNVKGYNYNPEKARKLLAEAGYANGAGFPDLIHNINSGGGRNEQIAEATQKMLKENLNIDVEIVKMPFAQHLENLETGKADFWRSGWVADYPDPENFLNLLYSKHIPATLAEKSYINSCRYSSPQFDGNFEQALATVNEKQRMQLYQKADQIAMDDAAIIPLFYYKDIRLLQPNVRNFPQNAMEYRDMTEVYFVPE